MAAVALSATASWADVTTMVFDGEDNMAGLTRQTTTKPENFVKEVSYSQDGVDFKLEVTGGTGNGYALVNAGGTNAGLFVSQSVDTKITLNVPNGHVTAATIRMSGYAMSSLDVTFNGKEIASDGDGSIYFWSWNDSNGGETLTITWPSTFMARYIHSLEVTYTPDLGGKEAPGLSFRRTSTEGFVGEPFTAPSLSNPNKLPVTWSSTDTAVATVNGKGQVTIVGKGTTVIIAATEGNDQYAAGNARYNLTAIPVANSVAEMFELAPAKNDRVKVNFPMTTYFAYSPNVYAVDEEMTACCFTDTRNEDDKPTAFSKGDIVPANWVATNDGGVNFKGRPDDPTETGEVFYPEVTSVSKVDANRVVILKNVTFANGTPVSTTSAKGTIPDGTTYTFQNPFNTPDKPAGTYDVTLIVKYEVLGSTEYFYMAPISYADAEGGGGDIVKLPPFPESFVAEVDVEGIDIEQEDDDYEYYIFLAGETAADTVTLTLDVPQGWDGFYCAGSTGEIDDEDAPTPFIRKQARAAADDEEDPSIDIRELLAYFPDLKKGNSVTLKVGDDSAYGIFFLYKGDLAHYKAINVNPALTKTEGPAFPESFEMTLNDKDLTVTQGEDQGVYTIAISGKTEATKVTVILDVPEGWDGFIGQTDNAYDPEIDPLGGVNMVAEEPEWVPVDMLLEAGLKEGNVFEFIPDGEEHGGILYLYKGALADTANTILIEFTAENDNISGIDSVEASDSGARYFNIHGVEVNRPDSGIYVKISNGKASKVNIK